MILQIVLQQNFGLDFNVFWFFHHLCPTPLLIIQHFFKKFKYFQHFK